MGGGPRHEQLQRVVAVPAVERGDGRTDCLGLDDPAPLVLGETTPERILDAAAQVVAVDANAATRITAGIEMPGAPIVTLIAQDDASEQAGIRANTAAHAGTLKVCEASSMAAA